MNNIAPNRTIAACIARGNTSIPLRKSLSRQSSNGSLTLLNNMKCATDEGVKWKNRCEESEKKRKDLIFQHEKSKCKNIDVYSGFYIVMVFSTQGTQ